MTEFEAALVEVVQRSQCEVMIPVSSFRFEYPSDVQYNAGQYFIVNIEVEGNEYRHHFSFSTSPTESIVKGYLEFTTKLRNSDFKMALRKMKEGDIASLNAPFGSFTIGDTEKIAMLTGGIGITAMRSLCKYCTDKKIANIILLYSTHCEKDLVFKEDFEEMLALNSNLKLVYTLTRPGDSWEGRRGRIDADMIKAEIPDYLERTFYLSGPVSMVSAMEKLLLELDLPKEKIKKEIFPGY